MLLRVAVLLGVLGVTYLYREISPGQELATSIVQTVEKPESTWLSAINAPSSPFPLLAQAGAVLDRRTGEIFFERNKDKALPIASLTKLMTAMVVLDQRYGQLNPVEQDLFYKMLVYSDNEAAEVLIGKDGLEQMNQTATSLGMKQTFFKDASGLSEYNISSVADVLLMTEASLKYPSIWEALKLRSYNGIDNTNELLGRFGIIAGKTGFTDQAGQCLILLSQDVITIVLNATDRFSESEKLIKLFRGTRHL